MIAPRWWCAVDSSPALGAPPPEGAGGNRGECGQRRGLGDGVDLDVVDQPEEQRARVGVGGTGGVDVEVAQVDVVPAERRPGGVYRREAHTVDGPGDGVTGSV